MSTKTIIAASALSVFAATSFAAVSTPADTKTPPAKHVSKQHGKQHTKNIHKTAHHHSAAGTSVAK
jgi:Spy/CpxP family protein refolding chaperone